MRDRVRLSSLTSQSHLSNSLSPHRSGHPHSPFSPPLLGLPPRPSLLGEDPRPRSSWKGSELAFVWTYCSVPLFTQSLKLYVLLSLNCIGLCCPLVSQYHLSDDISSSIQRGISRWCGVLWESWWEWVVQIWTCIFLSLLTFFMVRFYIALMLYMFVTLQHT